MFAGGPYTFSISHVIFVQRKIVLQAIIWLHTNVYCNADRYLASTPSSATLDKNTQCTGIFKLTAGLQQFHGHRNYTVVL